MIAWNYQFVGWDLETRHLRCFVALAEELHFGRAAARLHIAQPALSQLIQRVERGLEAQLFERTQRRVEMTDAGRVLLPEARRILRDIDRVTEDVRLVQRGEAGTMTLGFVGSAADDVLPRLVAAYGARHPRVAVRLEEGTTAQQLDWLRDERIAAGLARTPVDADWVSVMVVMRESLVLAVSDGHSLADQSSVELAAVRDERFIMFPRHLGAGLYERIYQSCATAGFVPTVAYETIRMQTIAGLVAGGLGVALMPSSVRNLSRAGVCYLDIVDEVADIELSLLWRSDTRSPHLRSLISIAQQLDTADHPRNTRAANASWPEDIRRYPAARTRPRT